MGESEEDDKESKQVEGMCLGENIICLEYNYVYVIWLKREEGYKDIVLREQQRESKCYCW